MCQLKGGSGPNHEFYCTYTSFKIKNIQVYTQEDLDAPSLVNDYPINLRSAEVLGRNPEALPHMRFLLADKQMLELAFMVLICGPRVGSSITLAESSKIEECLDLLIQKFFRCEHSFKQLKAASHQIQSLHEDEIALLSKKPVDYYRAKVQDKFRFVTWGEDSAELPEAATLELPFVKEEPGAEDRSDSKEKDVQSNSSSNDNGGSSDSNSSSRQQKQPNPADLKQ